MEPDNPLLDRYILSQATTDKPKICFIGTASGDNPSYIDRFYKFFGDQRCIPTHLSLFKLPTLDFEDYLFQNDIIYVGGGSTTNLMILWKYWGLNNVIEKAYNKGVILTGISAGSICWFKEGLSEVIVNLQIPVEQRLVKVEGMGLINGSNCPHFDGESYRQSTYIDFIKRGKLTSGYAADDGIGLHFINGQFFKSVSSRPNSKSFFIDNNSKAEIITTYLGQ
jgi:dipeptidase E